MSRHATATATTTATARPGTTRTKDPNMATNYPTQTPTQDDDLREYVHLLVLSDMSEGLDHLAEIAAREAAAFRAACDAATHTLRPLTAAWTETTLDGLAAAGILNPRDRARLDIAVAGVEDDHARTADLRHEVELVAVLSASARDGNGRVAAAMDDALADLLDGTNGLTAARG